MCQPCLALSQCELLLLGLILHRELAQVVGALLVGYAVVQGGGLLQRGVCLVVSAQGGVSHVHVVVTVVLHERHACHTLH